MVGISSWLVGCYIMGSAGTGRGMPLCGGGPQHYWCVDCTSAGRSYILHTQVENLTVILGSRAVVRAVTQDGVMYG